MTVQEWLGEDNLLGIDIWTKKYQQNGETFEEWLDRVSGGNAKIRELIKDRKFLFGGRILSNRKMNEKGEKITLSNCYVISPPEDNIESIFECASKLARTYSYGGGCGTDLSKLSPRGAKVNNTAKKTTGSVSFMDLFDLTTGLIGQNGRRGALMLSISCTHPDLLEFIDIKSDLDKVNNANISIRITNEFMEAVNKKEPFTLSFTRMETGETITKEIDAYEVFRKICEMNWDYAEPGMLFWDKIENWNLVSEDDNFEYAGTNPCVTGDTLISTIDGEIPISELVGETPYVYCKDYDGSLVIRQASRVWQTRKNAQLVLIETYRGCLRCTPDHLIHTRNRGWVEAADLRRGDKITGLNRMMKDETHVAVGLSGSNYVAEHRLVASVFYDISGKDVHHLDGDTLNNTISNLEVLSHDEHSALTNTGRKIESNRGLDGRYLPKTVKARRHSFNLGGGVGTNWTVRDVVWLEEREDVYDMTVPDVHNFVANRMVVHNCAEEPLPQGGSCLLGSINLAEFVKNGEFDFKDFRNTVHESIIALNEVLIEGLPLHPLQEQRDSVGNWRQVGLGIFGLCDMLIKMSIRYGSSTSIELCNAIGYMMADEALKTSALLAKEHGTYPMYDTEAVLRSPYLHTNATPETLELIKQYGLYNSQLLTIAPTGSLSTMLGVTGGIEPIFANSYTRKTQSLHGKDEYYKVYTPIVKDYMEKNDISDETDLPNFFVTAGELNYKERIDMQSVWQKHIDASISSTVNVAKEFTVEETMDLYNYAWKKGLKGVTIFRDGCARIGVLTTTEETTATQIEEPAAKFDHSVPVTRKELGSRLQGSTYVKEVACGKLYITINRDADDNLVEVFIDSGKSGGCTANAECLGRYASAAMRDGMSIQSIIDITKGVKCSACTQVKGSKSKHIDGLSCGDVLARTISEEYNFFHGPKTEIDISKKESTNPKCPECGAELTFEGGCNICKNCGYSKCD